MIVRKALVIIIVIVIVIVLVIHIVSLINFGNNFDSTMN